MVSLDRATIAKCAKRLPRFFSAFVRAWHSSSGASPVPYSKLVQNFSTFFLSTICAPRAIRVRACPLIQSARAIRTRDSIPYQGPGRLLSLPANFEIKACIITHTLKYAFLLAFFAENNSKKVCTSGRKCAIMALLTSETGYKTKGVHNVNETRTHC